MKKTTSQSRLDEATRQLAGELDWGGIEHLDEIEILQRATELQKLVERAKRGDPAAALASLETVPNVPPEPGDEMPDEEAG